MSDDFYPGPAEDRISEFTRARATEVRAELIAIAESMAQLPSLTDLFFNRLGYAVATGTANAIAVTATPAPTAYLDGMGLTVKVLATNTGPATINVNNLGVKALRRPDGAALSAGDLQAGALVNIRYEGTSGEFRVMVGTVTINQEGIDLVTSQAAAYAAEAEADRVAAAASAAAAAASIAPYTANDVLAKLLTVDGTGSGLDADRVRGTTPGSFGATLLASTSLTQTRTDLGISAVNNTSDADKPISTATAAALALKADKASPVFSGAVTLGQSPTADLHAATKAYVDALSQGWRTLTGGSVRLATTAPSNLTGLTAIDGVTPVAGDRILVKSELPQYQYLHGVYVAAAGAWSRADDANTWNEIYNTATLVREGTTQSNSLWVASVGIGGTLGTDAIPFSQVGAQTTYTASNGLTKVTNDIQLAAIAANSILGNNTGGSAVPTALTGAQVAALLPTFTAAAKGLVPAVASSTNAYLRADGTFASALTPASLAASGTVTGSNLSGTNTGDQTITLTGHVTGSGTGSFATTIANNAVSLGKIEQLPSGVFLGRNTSGTGNAETISAATAKAMLNLSGTNTGDQTAASLGLGPANSPAFANLEVTGGVIWLNSAHSYYLQLSGGTLTMPSLNMTVGGTFSSSNFSGTHSGTSSGTNTGDQTTITGNAGSATALQTARNFSISGAVTAPAVSFNGTGNVVLAVSTLDVGQANAGTLAVARGGTGTTTSTGSGSVVLNNAPSFAGTSSFVNISASGTITATGDISSSGNVSAYSDARLKTNVATIHDGLDKVNQMRGVTFQRKTDRAQSSGVIAQELRKVAPELVSQGDDGMLRVAYPNLVGYLIEAVKTLTKRVEELEGKIP